MLKKVQNHLKRWKSENFSIMIIPNAGSSMKQIRIQALCVYSALFLVISAGLFLSVATVTLIRANFSIHAENQTLAGSVSQREKDLAQLNQVNSLLRKENNRLRNSTELSTEYFNRRVAELNQLQSQVDTLLGLFNQQNNSNIRLRTDRSAPQMKSDYLVSVLSRSRTIGDLEQSDHIPAEMQQQIDEYRRVVSEVRKELSFMDCKPDHMPLLGRITSAFGYRDDPMNAGVKPHEGIDIDGSTGDPVAAAGAGTVTFAGYSGSYGNMIVVTHGSGYQSAYAHLSEINVASGDTVKKCQLIGRVGSTGRSTGSHLHFEIHVQGKLVDPMKIITR